MTKKIKTISYDHRASLFWFLVATALLSLLIYIYSINTIARNIAVRQNLEEKITQTTANLATLEFNYIELKNNVTIELAQSHGFKEVKDPLYVSRSPSASLSFNTLDQ